MSRGNFAGFAATKYLPAIVRNVRGALSTLNGRKMKTTGRILIKFTSKNSGDPGNSNVCSFFQILGFIK